MRTIRARQILTTSSELDQSHLHYHWQTSSFPCEISYAPTVNLIAFPVSDPSPVLRWNPSFICGTDRGDRHGCRLHNVLGLCSVQYHATLSLRHLNAPVSIDRKFQWLKSGPCITTDFSTIPIFYCRSHCISTYQPNSIWMIKCHLLHIIAVKVCLLPKNTVLD
jgi:hypothetical protein